jgi:hypothetical protein
VFSDYMYVCMLSSATADEGADESKL